MAAMNSSRPLASAIGPSRRASSGQCNASLAQLSSVAALQPNANINGTITRASTHSGGNSRTMRLPTTSTGGWFPNDRAINERNSERRAHDRRAHVARSVVIAPPQMMTVFAVARRQLFEHRVQIFDGSWLELDRGHARRRSDNEHRDNARAHTAARHRLANLPGDIPDISLSIGGNLEVLRRDHRGRISRPAEST